MAMWAATNAFLAVILCFFGSFFIADHRYLLGAAFLTAGLWCYRQTDITLFPPDNK